MDLSPSASETSAAAVGGQRWALLTSTSTPPTVSHGRNPPAAESLDMPWRFGSDLRPLPGRPRSEAQAAALRYPTGAGDDHHRSVVARLVGNLLFFSSVCLLVCRLLCLSVPRRKWCDSALVRISSPGRVERVPLPSISATGQQVENWERPWNPLRLRSSQQAVLQRISASSEFPSSRNGCL